MGERHRTAVTIRLHAAVLDRAASFVLGKDAEAWMRCVLPCGQSRGDIARRGDGDLVAQLEALAKLRRAQR